MDNNYLFLAMQTGGQLSPEQLQRAQQMGQLPQMNMGAGLTDIQKMNMAEDQHYGMFRRGGVPMRYAQGGEQEEIDQQYMSPYTQYNQRVSEFLENLKATAMSALQDEMVGVNDEYADEADQIEMEEAQYGRQVSSPTLNPQGMNAVNAWMGAAQNTKDLTTPLAQTAGLASGLKGYFGDQAAYEANPYNSAWNPTRLTVTNKDTGDKTVTRARRDGFFQPGGESNPGDYYANGDPEAYDANGQLKPGYTTFTGVSQPMAGSPITPFGGAGIAGQIASLVRTGKFLSDNLPKPTSPSTGVGPFTGNVGAPATASGSTGVGPFTGNMGAPVTAAAEQIPNTVTPNWYSAFMQAGKSQGATGQAMNAYGEKARTDEAAYNAQQAAQAQKTEIEQNAIRMGWVNPDGTADVAGYSAPGADGKSWGYKPGFDPNAATNAALPTSTKKKETGPKGGGSKGAGSAGSGSGSGAGATTTGTTTTPPTGTEVVKNADGTESSLSPEEAAKRKADAAAQAAQVVDPGKTPAATETGKGFKEGDVVKADGSVWRDGVMVFDGKGTIMENNPNASTKTGTGEIDYLGMMADPTGQNAGGVYSTDRNGNPVPMAFYDPNMRLNRMSADYRNNAASWFRKNKRPGQMKSLTFDFSSGTPYTVPGQKAPAASPQAPAPGPMTQSPNVNDTSGATEVTGLTTNPQFDMNWRGNQQRPMYPAPTQNVPANRGPITSMNDLVPNGVEVGPQGNVSAGLPTSINNTPQTSGVLQAAQQAPLTAKQQKQIDKINARTQRKVGNIQADTPGAKTNQDGAPANLKPNTPTQGADGNWYTLGNNGQIEMSMDKETSRKKASSKRYGGQYFQPGGENQEGIGVLSNPVDPTPNTNFFETGLLPQAEESNYMSPALPGETVFENDKYMRAKYDKNKKDNPFFAPAMLAGLNLVAGAGENMDSKKKENELRGKLSYDQIYSANPETSGSRGDWTFNEGYMRPNDMVPTQFTGNGMQMAQMGGAYSEGDELYLDEDEIQAFLAAGGQLDYLD